MPRVLAALLFVFTTSVALAQPDEASTEAPVTPDAPQGTVASADDDFVVNRFELTNAGDLRAICSVTDQHPDYDTTRSFCIGYVTGALNYYRAIASGPNMGGFICSDRPIRRTDIINAFLEWSAANPGMDSAPAIENVMRAAASKWPCGA